MTYIIKLKDVLADRLYGLGHILVLYIDARNIGDLQGLIITRTENEWCRLDEYHFLMFNVYELPNYVSAIPYMQKNMM